jgi:hypothetical protein
MLTDANCMAKVPQHILSTSSIFFLSSTSCSTHHSTWKLHNRIYRAFKHLEHIQQPFFTHISDSHGFFMRCVTAILWPKKDLYLKLVWQDFSGKQCNVSPIFHPSRIRSNPTTTNHASGLAVVLDGRNREFACLHVYRSSESGGKFNVKILVCWIDLASSRCI